MSSATVADTTASPPRTKPPRVLACVHCQYRKIKCDRQQPCANCLKAKVVCKPSTPAQTHKRRRPNQDLLERLARCEQLLKQYADSKDAITATTEPTESSNGTPPHPSSCGTRLGTTSTASGEVDSERAFAPDAKVIQEDGNVAFMDNSIRISFHEEIAALRSMVDNEDLDSEPNVAGHSPDNSTGMFFGVEDSAIDIQAFHPSFAHVFQLWQLFKVRIDPLTKAVHIPSLEPYVSDAAVNINGVPLPYQALLFSIYTLTVKSLTLQESVQFFGMHRDDAINQFSRGAKLALTRCNFLQNYNMTILQALIFYMLSMLGRADSNATWILGGTVMRIAQKMGYHRDGEQFNLPPFETEMRRRIWWQLITQDSRYAVLAGLSQSWVPSNWDTKLPLNINDVDFMPNSEEPFVAREGPTEMACVLMLYHYQAFTTKTHRQFEDAFMSLRNDGDRGAIETYRALLDEVDLELEALEKRLVNPSSGGVHSAAAMIRPLYVEKMKCLMIPTSDQPEYGTEIFDLVDSLFKTFVDLHFKQLHVFKQLTSTGLTWYFRFHFQLDSLLLFIHKLYKRPIGTLSDRAWTALETLHDIYPEFYDLSQKRMERQAHFTVKAWAVREQAFAQRGQRLEVPKFIQYLRQLLSWPRSTMTFSASSESPGSGCQPVIMPQQTPPYHQPLLDLNHCLATNMGSASYTLDMWGNLMMDHDADLPEQNLSHHSSVDFSKLDFNKLDFSGTNLG